MALFSLAFSTLSLAATDGFAQTDPPDRGAVAPQPKPLPKQQAGDSVASRIGRLEQQFLDLQVSVGTLETLLRAEARCSAAARGGRPASGGVDAAAPLRSAISPHVSARSKPRSVPCRARTAFRQLIAAYPNDPLASSAQYWIGESYYVRGQYKNAADAFLKG